MTSHRLALGTVLVLASAATLSAESPPSFAQQVRPFLMKYCVECHNTDEQKAELNVEDFKTLVEGGRQGAVFVPGKPEASSLVLTVEGKAKPTMPPRNARQPKREEIAVLRAWVATGARDDSDKVKPALPDIRPKQVTLPSVRALAYSPDGKLLAAGRHREVTLFDPDSGAAIGRLGRQTATVTAMAFSRDGRLFAVASGPVGIGGELRLYRVGADGKLPEQPDRTIMAHRDLIHEVVFSPDGKALATCSYDRLIKLWDTSTGQELRILKDHSDAVFGLAFSPDGRLLASAAADRAVKVWDVATGRRLYTLGEATDWLYAAAWSPDGKHLVAGGVDKSLRVWAVSADGGRIARSVFAHEGAVLRILYAADGKTLYSLGEDRVIKVWDTARMTERKLLPRQSEAVLALALRPPATSQLAVGRYDGHLFTVDADSGKVAIEMLPVKPRPPQVLKVRPDAAPRGGLVYLTLEGKNLDQVTELSSTIPGAALRLLAEDRHAAQLRAELTIPAATLAGSYAVAVKGPTGPSSQAPFVVDLFPATAEKVPNNSLGTAQPISLPTTIIGALDQAGEIDYFRFIATPGQAVGVQALVQGTGSNLDPVLQVTDATGRVLAEGANGLLGFVGPTAGAYGLTIRDREYRGGKEFRYRLHIGNVPVVTSVFPLGLQRGQEIEARISGVHLGDIRSVRVKAPADAPLGQRIPLSLQLPGATILGVPSLVVGEFPEVMPIDGSSPSLVPVPGTANGLIAQPSAADLWRFQAGKGQRLILEVNARRLGSPLDSFIEVLDAQGQPVPRAVLRCLAKTYTTFRDHDSAGPGIRMDTWGEFAMNDFVWVGNELLRIRALPKNPDDDCQFVSVAGQRAGFLDTTPTHLSMGAPMYKVEIHPPGTTFPANGLPVIALPYRNDDGGPGYGKDSRLVFDAPADGMYLVRVRDARSQAGPTHAYRLTIREPRPSYSVSFTPTAPSVWKGGAVPITVNAERVDGYDGAIEVRLENLPPGFSAPVTTIPAEENSTAFALYAAPDAVSLTKGSPLKLVARASIKGQPILREATGAMPKVTEPGDLVTTTEQSELTVRPGQEVRLTARIERRGDFKGRVPLDVRGLPHGVHVLDVGLNGILITEQETVRTFTIYCEPWVQPTTHPFVVLARSERKGTEHAAKSVLLCVVK